MPIRWSALKVKEAMDRVEETIKPILQPLEEAKAIVKEAQNIPNLPEYMQGRLCCLWDYIDRVSGGVSKYSNEPYQGFIHRAIQSVRDNLPKNDLAREQAQFQKWLDLFDGDRDKALTAMNITAPEPKHESQKDQPKMELSGENLVVTPDEQLPEKICDDGTIATQNNRGKRCEDYGYCEDCECFFDLWNFESIEDTEHAGCNWRNVTEEELPDCIEMCEAMGCFDEDTGEEDEGGGIATEYMETFEGKPKPKVKQENLF